MWPFNTEYPLFAHVEKAADIITIWLHVQESDGKEAQS